jgi:hypothetical protein
MNFKEESILAIDQPAATGSQVDRFGRYARFEACKSNLVGRIVLSLSWRSAE